MKVVSFFSGCGGLDLGFEQAGFHVVWANEYDSAVCKTYIKNHPNTEFIFGDINKITPIKIPDCDGFIGGPPCQSWSVAGKQRGLDDARGKLFLTYIELIKDKRPKFFLIENVKGMLDAKFSNVFQDFIDRLDSAGYDVKWKLLDAVDFNVPQNRERVFLIGFRKDLSIKYDFPSSTCTQPITLIQAIGDITEEPTRYSGKTRVVPNIQRSNHDVLVSEFGPFYFRGNRRRGWQQPSFTIHATADNIQLHPSSPKMLFYGHERWNFQKDKIGEYRRLSVRECARIQTFPDSFVFECDDIKACYKMIGNAVPPRLGKVLAQSILNSFSQASKTQKYSKLQSHLTDACTLVGYYKSSSHYDLIIKNLLYYVRADGRVGSVFRETCEITPKYLLLHHKDEASLFELDSEEPVLTDSYFLKKCGFSCRGDSYLCFRLKYADKLNIQELVGYQCVFVYNKSNYAPLFTTLNKIIKKMNVDSEQITLDKNLVIAQDQPYSEKQLKDCMIKILGAKNCRLIILPPRKIVLEYKEEGKTIHFLIRACTYLGNPHPIFKKRVQLPLWFNEYTCSIQKLNPNVDVRYIGVYHFGDKNHGDNVVFVDFKKDTYLLKKGHNSSAHVYTNDLFQAMTYGIFSKEDQFGNTITTIRRDCLKDYLLNRQRRSENLFDLFRQFNNGFSFGQWLKALDVIKEMHQNEWHQWKQAEWAGWFLEYKFNKFTIDENLTHQMRYVGSSLKREGDLDFDIRFDEANFYGDLKASDISKKETPGNDQKNLIECIYQFDKFWYVIYEHETIKDSEVLNYEATRARNRYIKSVDPSYDKDELSYHERMKSEVKFVKMSIVELNRINFREALTDFHQGHQSDGSPRALKFNINKKVLENDNFVVFRYTYRKS